MEQYADAIGRGVVAAWETYGRWSENFYVHDEGIEAFLCVKIAECLHQSFPDACRVRLEVPFNQLRENCAARTVDGPAILASGRADVAFYDQSRRLTGVVEVKRHFMASRIREDVLRIKAMLQCFGKERGGSMRWGAVAAMHTIWSSNKKTTEERLSNAAKALERETAGAKVYARATKSMLSKPMDMEGSSLLGCAGMCILLSS